ncbi:HK97 gp10 family phage protein [Sphingomonas sanxanigenens]|uniref:HK97 gp10 family phage protein n=1 Tax=Sphingomonas sanxanigenens DSM 19645 = NX02 TaxID=1123269 RepID=W0AM61_9SPHN|nr:HK97 gp10 family phage protein [Sphingomonas sanxanigenens]AHE57428.1 hypothetical protein NX02_29320 [Sphingomonas sanxanigenens DSM 19645 = NX02]
MKVKMRVQVDESIARRLRSMRGALNKRAMMKIMRPHLEPLAQDMKARVRRRTGELYDSIGVGTRLNPAQQAAHVPIARVEMFVGAGPLPQAIQEEWGNFHQQAHPFVAPAFDAGAQRAVDGIAMDGLVRLEQLARKG